jgi:hypothetical protein
MKYLYGIFAMLVFSCTSKRDFFQNMPAKNYFLDTFSQAGLKGFGLSPDPFIKQGSLSYIFNKQPDYINCSGYFLKADSGIFFLPANAEKKLLFMRLPWSSSSTMIKPRSAMTTDNLKYTVEQLGPGLDKELNDSVLAVKIETSGIGVLSEQLIFRVSKALDIVGMTHVNCKADSLVIRLIPRQSVYFKTLHKAAGCL